MEISRKWRFSCLLLGLFFLATTLQGVQGEVELDGPSESECRPYIEKALKELETVETEPADRGTSQEGEDVRIEETTNDSEHDTSAEPHDPEQGDSIETPQDEDAPAPSAESEQAEEEVQSIEGSEATAEGSQEANSEQPASSQEQETPQEDDESAMQQDAAEEATAESVEEPAEEVPADEPAVEEGAAESQEGNAESLESAAESQEGAAESLEGAAESQESEDAAAESQEPAAESQEPAAESQEAPAESQETAQETVTESQEVAAESQEASAESHEAAAESLEVAAEAEEVSETEEVAETEETAPVEGSESQEAAAESQEAAPESLEAAAESQEAAAESQEAAAESQEVAAESQEAAAESQEALAESQEAAVESQEAVAAESHETTAESQEAAAESQETADAESQEAVESQEGATESLETTAEEIVEETAESLETAQETKSQEAAEGAESAEAPAEQSESIETTEPAASAEQAEEAAQSSKTAESLETVEKVEDVASSETVETVDAEKVEEIAEEPKEEVPEEELINEIEIPEDLRPRDHIEQLLKLDDSNSESESVLNRVSEVTLRELKRLYEGAIKPLETLYKYRDLSNRHFGDSEIFSKPLVVFMGPWSGGKSSLINYLLDNEYNTTSLRTGAEPSPAYFNLVMHGDEPEVLDGTQLAADFTFSGLQKFGQGLEERLRGLKLPNKLLEKINIVEIPGILEVRKQVSRVFPFNDACQWFIDRADIIFLVYDPSKLDVGPETEAILDQLKGREHQTRIILNKADQVKPEELMRVQGALIWNISPLMSSAQPPLMYTTSLWSRPYESWAPVRLLQAQERAFLRDLRSAVDKRIENKISSARRFAVRVRNHAKMVDCYLTTYYNHKSVFGNRKQVSDQIIEHPQDYHIYEGLSTLTNISRYDLPDPDVYRDFFRLNPLYDFQQLSATCTYFRGCPINRLDIAIAYDLPEMVGKHKKLIEAAAAEIKTES